MVEDHSERPIKWTGLICRKCRKPICVIERTLLHGFAFRCPACDYQWSNNEPYLPKPLPSEPTDT